jgi:DNA-binding transcriptional ArsR family regulator
MARKEASTREDAYEAVFSALAHPARRRILLTVYFEGGSMKAGAIAEMFEHAWPTTTRHLKVLESAGLLHHERDERDGRTRWYRIDRKRLKLVADWLAWFNRDPCGRPEGENDGRGKEQEE